LTALGYVAAVERAALQRQTMRVLVSAQVLGGLAIGVGASVSPLLAKEILDGDATFAGLAFRVVDARCGRRRRDRGGQDFGTNVTVTFEERDGKTLLTIVETGFERKDDRDGSVEDGWPRILDALERVAAERRST
jgi:hypothetical protein